MDDAPLHDLRDSLSERMASAARHLQDEADPEATYAMAADLAVTNVDGCETASLSIIRARKIETKGATTEAARHADTLQSTLDEGPCLDAIRSRFAIHSPSLAYDRRWPTWGPRVAEETGLHSVMSYRLYSHALTVGALNMYSSRRDAFSDEDRIDGVALAAHTAMAVVATQSATNKDYAIASRTVIGQATGILMERYGLSADIAFKTLVRVSSTEQVKLRDVAAELVETLHLRGTGAAAPPS